MECLCGCGEEIKPGRKYISGHNLRCLKMTEEHKRNIGVSNKGKKRTPEQKKKISNNHADVSGENNPMFNKKQSENTKNKIRESKKGKSINFSEEDIERRRKLMIENNPMKRPEIKSKFQGENNPMKRPEVKAKFQGDNNFFRKHPELVKKGKDHPMYGVSRFGKDSPNWKGGCSWDKYCDSWRDKNYKQSIMERDGNKCLNPGCNQKSNNLCLHHIDYNKKYCHPDNLITVCKSCNSKANADREWHKSWYKAIIERRYGKI